MAPDGTNATQLSTGGALYVEPSRDGEWLYYNEPMQPYRVHRMKPDGGDDRVVMEGGARGMRSGKSGLWFLQFATAGLSLRVLRPDGTMRDVTTVGFPNLFVNMSVSPDERHVLVTRADTSGGDLFLVDGFR
jgi:hypothetical protein